MSILTIPVDEQLIRQARCYVKETDKGLAKQRAQATARLMATIEAATPRSRASVEPAAAPRRRRQRTLREELHEGDFRGRGRASAKAARTPRDESAMLVFLDTDLLV